MIIILWIAMACLVGWIAAKRGRGAIAWGLYGLLLWPVALIHILMLPKDRLERAPCPHCREPVIVGATTCPHCRSAVTAPLPGLSASVDLSR